MKSINDEKEDENFKKQNGKRWIFTPHQIDLINKFLGVIE